MSDPTERLPPADPFRRTKYSEVIADDLRALIAGEGRPGDYLPSERVLLERYGVSRPTLREALRILEVEGLVKIRRGAQGGAVIKEPSIEAMTRTFGVYLQQHGTPVQDVISARLVIEPVAARLAALNPDKDLSEMEAVLAREKIVVTEHSEAIADTEAGFHLALLGASGNFTLASLGNLLQSVVARHAAENYARFADRGGRIGSAGADLLQEGHRAHRLVYEAIKAGDAEKAERRTRTHLKYLLEGLPFHPGEIPDIAKTFRS